MVGNQPLITIILNQTMLPTHLFGPAFSYSSTSIPVVSLTLASGRRPLLHWWLVSGRMPQHWCSVERISHYIVRTLEEELFL